MKKIYAIYGTVELTDRPSWLDEYQRKYDRQHPLHITLKQLAYIDFENIKHITETLEALLKKHSLTQKGLQVYFDLLMPCEHDADDGKGYIYVNASKHNNMLDELQIDIRQRLVEYSDYYLQDSYRYEHDFNPHITIASGLQGAEYAAALSELEGKQIRLSGIITTITISMVDHVTLSEANDPANLTAYSIPAA